MDLKSMQMSSDDQKKYSQPTALSDAPEYPYGLVINLDETSIKKLGISLPEVGAVMKLEALVEVCSVSKYETNKGEADRSLGLQITAMAIGLSKKGSDDVGKALYGSEKK